MHFIFISFFSSVGSSNVSRQVNIAFVAPLSFKALCNAEGFCFSCIHAAALSLFIFASVMVRILTFGSITIWLYIQQLRSYKSDNLLNLTDEPIHICYFKFNEPTFAIFGELIMDDNNVPKIFKSPEEADQFARVYLEKKFRFRSGFSIELK